MAEKSKKKSDRKQKGEKIAKQKERIKKYKAEQQKKKKGKKPKKYQKTLTCIKSYQNRLTCFRCDGKGKYKNQFGIMEKCESCQKQEMSFEQVNKEPNSDEEGF